MWEGRYFGLFRRKSPLDPECMAEPLSGSQWFQAFSCQFQPLKCYIYLAHVRSNRRCIQNTHMTFSQDGCKRTIPIFKAAIIAWKIRDNQIGTDCTGLNEPRVPLKSPKRLKDQIKPIIPINHIASVKQISIGLRNKYDNRLERVTTLEST